MAKAPYFGFRGQALHRAVVGLAGLGFLLFGYDQGVMGGLLTLPSFVAVFPEMDVVNTTGAQKSFNSQVQGVSIAIYEIGCMAGALSTLYYGDRVGRRKMIFVGAIIMTVGAILQTAAFGLPQLIVGRIVTGVGNGCITATVPVWQSECARAEHRGRLVMIEGALITGGVALSYWIDFAFYFVPGQASWRVPIAFQIVFAVAIFCTVLQLPESPRWLIKMGRIEEAREVFAALDDVSVDDHDVFIQVEEIRATLPLVESGSLRDIFTYGKEKNFHRVCLGVFSQMIQQITGINLITYYAATVYETSIGLSPFNSKILAACNGTEYFAASWIAVFLIDRLGRRKLMLFGAAGMAASMAILTGTVYAATSTSAVELGLGPYNGLGNGGAGIAAAVFLFVFNTCFATGFLGTTWLYPAEITPLRIRAPANGLSTASNWLWNFFVVLITPICFDSIGYYTYTIFAVINLLIGVAIYFLYPETARRSLEEIDLIFADSNPMTPWDVVKIARDLPYDSHVTDGEKGVELSAEAKYALQVRERKGFSSSEKAKAEHFEHKDGPPARRFDAGAPTEAAPKL